MKKRHVRIYIIDKKERVEQVPASEADKIILPEFVMLSTEIFEFLKERLTESFPEVYDMTGDVVHFYGSKSGTALLTCSEIAVRTVMYLVSTGKCTAELYQYFPSGWFSCKVEDWGGITSPMRSCDFIDFNKRIEFATIHKLPFNG